MKRAFFKAVYMAVSWLNDQTGKRSLLLRWKTALAVIVIGLSTNMLTGCKPDCYQPAEPTCYDPVSTEAAHPIQGNAPSDDHIDSAELSVQPEAEI